MAVPSTHVVRVQRLYRQSLKLMLNWAVHRELWISEGKDMRAQFEANRHQDNPRVIEKLVSMGEAKLKDFAHPAPYIIPTDFGGSKYMRHPNNGAGYSPSVCAIPAWIK